MAPNGKAGRGHPGSDQLGLPCYSAATASSMDCRSVSAAERVCDCDEGVQCPNERKPIFFMWAIYYYPGWLVFTYRSFNPNR